MKRSLLSLLIPLFGTLVSPFSFASTGVIEKQLQEIGSVSNEEVVVVQRQYTTKNMRHELTPISLGGIPFGTVRRTLFGSAAYTLHLNDSFAWEAVNFAYTKTFFSSFADDVSAQAGNPTIKPDFQKLVFFATTGLQYSPSYGKISTFSRYIAYMEPFISMGVGLAKTDISSYLAFAPGIGMRIFFKEWFSMKLEFKDYIYTEKSLNRVTLQESSSMKNNYAVMLSLSFWLPKMPQ